MRLIFTHISRLKNQWLTKESIVRVRSSVSDSIELADEAGNVKQLSSRPHEYASRSFASRQVAVLLLVESAIVSPHCLLLFKFPTLFSLTASICTAQTSGEKMEQSVNYVPLLSALSKNEEYLSERTPL